MWSCERDGGISLVPAPSPARRRRAVVVWLCAVYSRLSAGRGPLLARALQTAGDKQNNNDQTSVLHNVHRECNKRRQCVITRM